MAFSKGNVSTESAEIKRYTGVGSAYVRGVNPSKEELEKFFDRDLDNAPEYVSTVEVNGEKIPQVRIDFLVEADPEKYPDVALKTRVTFFLRRAYRKSSAGKLQIIDKYGRTAWATPEEIKEKRVPVYSNGKPANIDAQYRLAYNGEEDLIKFLIAYLGINSPQKYVNGEWIMKPANELSDCEAMLEHIEEYFSGNVKEIKEIIAFQPNNKVKILFGVRTADDGRQYQSCYSRNFLKNSVSNYSRLDAEVKEAKNAGAYSTTEFEVSELHEYVVTPTNLETTPVLENNPFATATPWD